MRTGWIFIVLVVMVVHCSPRNSPHKLRKSILSVRPQSAELPRIAKYFNMAIKFVARHAFQETAPEFSNFRALLFSYISNRIQAITAKNIEILHEMSILNSYRTKLRRSSSSLSTQRHLASEVYHKYVGSLASQDALQKQSIHTSYGR